MLLPLYFIVTALSFCRHLIGEGNIKRRHSNNKAATKNMEWLCMALLGFLTSVLQPLFDKVAGLRDCNFIKKKASRQVFSCEYCAIFKISFLIEHLRWLLLNSMKLGFIWNYKLSSKEWSSSYWIVWFLNCINFLVLLHINRENREKTWESTSL